MLKKFVPYIPAQLGLLITIAVALISFQGIGSKHEEAGVLVILANIIAKIGPILVGPSIAAFSGLATAVITIWTEDKKVHMFSMRDWQRIKTLTLKGYRNGSLGNMLSYGLAYVLALVYAYTYTASEIAVLRFSITATSIIGILFVVWQSYETSKSQGKVRTFSLEPVGLRGKALIGLVVGIASLSLLYSVYGTILILVSPETRDQFLGSQWFGTTVGYAGVPIGYNILVVTLNAWISVWVRTDSTYFKLHWLCAAREAATRALRNQLIELLGLYISNFVADSWTKNRIENYPIRVSAEEYKAWSDTVGLTMQSILSTAVNWLQAYSTAAVSNTKKPEVLLGAMEGGIKKLRRDIQRFHAFIAFFREEGAIIKHVRDVSDENLLLTVKTIKWFNPRVKEKDILNLIQPTVAGDGEDIKDFLEKTSKITQERLETELHSAQDALNKLENAFAALMQELAKIRKPKSKFGKKTKK